MPDSKLTPTPGAGGDRSRLILAGIMAAFAVLGVLYSATVPIFEASDEVWHYPMVETIARTGRLPVQPLEPGTVSGPWRQEGSQPPLYYAIGAALTFWIDTSDMATVRHLNPHVKAGEITPERSNVNLVVHGAPQEAFPWSGTPLAVHIVRLFSVALGVWSVTLTWALVRELFPRRTWLAPAAAAIQAFTPMALFISSSVNNDNLIVPLSTLALLLMVRRVKAAGEAAPGSPVVGYGQLGGVVALALLTKASGIALLPLAAATLAWELWRFSGAPPKGIADWRRRVGYGAQALGALLVPVVAISGWWFARNFRLYGDWLGLTAFYAVLGTRDVPASVAQLWAERTAFAAGYWGNFGGLNVPMPAWVYRVLNGVAGVAAAGVVVRFGVWLVAGDPRSGVARPSRPRSAPLEIQAGGVHSGRGEAAETEAERGRRPADTRGIVDPAVRGIVGRVWPFAWSNETAAAALAWAWPAAVLVSWARWAMVTWSSQGRLIFSALPLWSLALALGLSVWVPRRFPVARRALPTALAVLLLGLSATALPAWILPAYRPPAPTTADAAALGMTPVDVAFGDTLALAGYRVETDATNPGGSVTLTLLWRALAPSAEDEAIFIHLLGQGERIVAQRDSFPGRGLVSTTQLQPGEAWTEDYVLAVPATAYAPDELALAVGVYSAATGARLAVSGGADAGAGIVVDADRVVFGQVALAPAAGDLALHAGEGMLLTGYGVSDLVVAPGATVTVTLDWQCTAPVDGDYTVSLQLIDANWNKVAQSDAWPQEGASPTSSWQVGQTIHESRALAIAPEAAPGVYDLRLTVYTVGPDGALVTAPLSLGGAEMPAKSIVLTGVRVR